MRPTEIPQWKRNTITAVEIGYRETPGLGPDTLRYQLAEQNALRRSKNYLVTEDMTAICKAAGATLPANPPMHVDLIPSAEGYLIYDVPIMDMVDPRDGEIVHIHGFFWTSDFNRQLTRMFPLIQRFQVKDALPNYLAMSMSEVWDWNKPLPDNREYHGESGGAWGIFDQPPYPLLYATWVIMNEKLIVSETEQGSRAEQKRCARDNTVSDVVVFRLRRISRENKGSTGKVEYSHRFLVSAYWRQQYHPSDGSHRLRYIATYVKGPEDKPLVVKDKVTVLAR